MAVPAYSTDLTDITTSFTTGWALTSEGGGGQNALTAPETDDFIQGTQAVSRNPFSSSIRGIIYDNAANVAVAAGDAVFLWWKADVAQALGTKAAGGVSLNLGTSDAIYKKFYVAGNDNYALGGWRCTPIDPSATESALRGSPGAPPYAFFGVAFNVPGAGPSKGFPFKIDMTRHGRQIDVTEGEIANPSTWDALTLFSDDISRNYGIVQGTNTGAEVQGIINWGTAAAGVYSRDSNRSIVFVDTEYTIANFTQLIFNNASSDIEWDAISITALGTNNRGIITVNNNAPFTMTNSTFTGINTTSGGGTNTVLNGSKWSGCNSVSSIGGSYLGCSILSPTVAIDASGFTHNVASDPDGKLNNMTFSKGVSAHHAIEFGSSSLATMTLRGIDFTGFNIANESNDSALYFVDTGADVNWTVNLVGCSGNISYKKVRAGDTVTLVADPVTYKITVQDTDGAVIDAARVFFTVATGGPLFFQASVTITRVGTVATVSHTAHGIANGDKVVIRGVNQSEYYGIHTVSNVTTNTYDYTVAGAPTTPATGTITSSVVLISELTDALGVVSGSRTFASNQPISGNVRKSSSSPYYKTGAIVGTINNTTGLDLTVTLLSDE
jgi:hypothetical protein